MPDTAIATTDARPGNELVKFREQLEQRAGELKMVLPSHISPEKFQRTILTAAQQNPQLLTVDRRSLVLACMKAAQDGLLPDGREAAIIPFKENKKIDGEWQTRWVAVYMPMVYGLRKKILQSGEVVALEVGVVYRKEVETNHFYYEVGRAPPLGHRPSLDLTLEDAGDENIVGAYSIATMKDGTKSYEFMRRFEIDKVRECSQTGATKDRFGKDRKPSGPWVEWFPEQAKKTAIRRHSKTLPQSGDVIIDVEGRELEANISTTALLDTHAGGEFERDDERNGLIEDQNDLPAHDRETGELIEDDANVTGDDTSTGPVTEAAKAEPEKKAAAGRGKAKAEPDKGPEPEKAKDKAAATVAAKEPEPAKAEGGAAPAQDEQTGVTADPFEVAADAYLDRFSKAENIIDLDKAHGEFVFESDGWPYEIVQAIEAGHKRHTRRLTPASAQQLETAK